ncbi:nicotinate phosphoribosyltransferase [Desulfofustis limnaeus]|jgi:nicotinate phosphoribosyltransferase|uniref:Nicotinate phosphoribosyltransferase n=1 Tax=Desulfofustis limnaeus TaxID=2740163 RepID=A0ABM7WDF1_9BACT|nr:nicotinate phosphoribosyltransferase [Desulfofustis limnaeus]MDX9894114.1 nicotinate phosphoribosyltransferase [Desulfofustis sp.]BDD89015.1 nicotinate phosphoribosyltransferase [Desulfofustis limnaeus]
MERRAQTQDGENVSRALATDLYQLTMAQGYFATGMADRASIFHMFYRSPPFGGRYVVAAGIGSFSEWLETFCFSKDDLAFLATLSGAGGRPLFSRSFLDYLARWRFRGSIDAIPEGTIVFPHQPMVRVRAPLLDAQLIETPLLAIVNHQSLIATKASRVRLAAGDDEVLEFGLRRAPGLEGGLAASRAAYIGGVDATSNVLAAQRFSIPARGTHAHSWVLAFADEQEAFLAYAELFPHNSVLLVDTYETVRGVRNAIAVGRRLRQQGAELLGIRLDSGDLAYLAGEARKLLDEAGFTATKIVASGDLDEHLLCSLKSQGAPIDVWGVGTKLVTAFDEPALGGVYKLAAVDDEQGRLMERMKICDQPEKTSIPGCLDTVRLKRDGFCVGDCIFDTLSESRPDRDGGAVNIISVTHPWQNKRVTLAGISGSLLLEPLFVDGQRVGGNESVAAMRQRTLDGLAGFDRTILRLLNPHSYPAGLSEKLYQRRETLRAAGLAANRHGLPNDRTAR